MVAMSVATRRNAYRNDDRKLIATVGSISTVATATPVWRFKSQSEASVVQSVGTSGLGTMTSVYHIYVTIYIDNVSFPASTTDIVTIVGEPLRKHRRTRLVQSCSN